MQPNTDTITIIKTRGRQVLEGVARGVALAGVGYCCGRLFSHFNPGYGFNKPVDLTHPDYLLVNAAIAVAQQVFIQLALPASTEGYAFIGTSILGLSTPFLIPFKETCGFFHPLSLLGRFVEFMPYMMKVGTVPFKEGPQRSTSEKIVEHILFWPPLFKGIIPSRIWVAYELASSLYIYKRAKEPVVQQLTIDKVIKIALLLCMFKIDFKDPPLVRLYNTTSNFILTFGYLAGNKGDLLTPVVASFTHSFAFNALKKYIPKTLP